MSQKVANMAPTWAQVGAMLGSKIVLDTPKSEEKTTPKTAPKNNPKNSKKKTCLSKEREARSSGNSKTRADTWKKRDRRKDTRKNE